MDSNIPALFAHGEHGPSFTIKDLSNALVRTGLEYPTANARIASYAKNFLIHVRAKGTGATSPNKFGLADMAAAVLLSALQDIGIADKSMLERVSIGLYAWTPGVDVTAAHPSLAALIETIAGKAFWQLQIDVYRHLQTGAREVVTSFYRASEIDPNVPRESDAVAQLRNEYPHVKTAADPRSSADHWPIATIMIPAATHLVALTAVVAPAGN